MSLSLDELTSSGMHRVVLPPGDAGVHLTLSVLSRLTAEAVKAHPEVWEATWKITYKYQQTDEVGQAKALLNYVQSLRWRPDPLTTELVYAPWLVMKNQAGDCEELTSLLASMCMVAGFECRWLVISTVQSKAFHHILLESLINGQWTGMEPSVKSVPLGWIPSGITRALRVPVDNPTSHQLLKPQQLNLGARLKALWVI